MPPDRVENGKGQQLVGSEAGFIEQPSEHQRSELPT